MPTEVQDAAHCQQLVAQAGSKLVVVDFYAVWCGPCRAVEPFFVELSSRYAHVAFLKVDVDKNPAVAAAYGVSAMPTFVFIKGGVKVDLLRGADRVALEDKVKKYAGTAEEAAAAAAQDGAAAGGGLVKGYVDLASFIANSGSECLNQSSEHPLQHALTPKGGHLASDCDEQLLITVAFEPPVRLHSLRIAAPRDLAPKTMKLFANLPHALDFDTAERMEPVQTLELGADDVSGEGVVALKFVKFQNVSKLTLFVKDNQGGGDVTQIDHLAFIGSPVSTTKMAEFKRIAGKKGESH